MTGPANSEMMDALFLAMVSGYGFFFHWIVGVPFGRQLWARGSTLVGYAKAGIGVGLVLMALPIGIVSATDGGFPPLWVALILGASFGLPSVVGFPLLWYWQRVASGQRRLRQTATAGSVNDVF